MFIRNNAELLCAAQYGYIELVKIILKKDDLDVNFQGAFSCSALIVSTKNNYVDIVKLLLNHKDININLQDNQGLTSLDWAMKLGHKEIINFINIKKEGH